MQKLLISHEGGLWIAHCSTTYGHVELLCGSDDEPDFPTLAYVELFLNHPSDQIAAIRRSALKFPRFWRPIRIAVNNSGRLGLQFMHRLTGAQKGMFFADEHSSFSTKLADISLADTDRDRLREIIPP